MFQHLLKTVNQPQSTQPNRQRNGSNNNDDGWNNAQFDDKNGVKNMSRERKAGNMDGAEILAKRMSNGQGNHEYRQEEAVRMPIDVNFSLEQSGRIEEAVSLNEETGEECHPMILSHINNALPNNFDRLSVLRIRNAASQLRQTYLDLTDYVDEQRLVFDELREELQHTFFNYALRWASSRSTNNQGSEWQQKLQAKSSECLKLSRDLAQCRSLLQKEQEKNKNAIRPITSSKRQQQKPCGKCRIHQGQLDRIREQLYQAEQQVEKLLIQNESLQEYIFDIQQKIVGVDLEVERRLKEKTKTIEKPSISPIKETQEIIEQLEAQITTLQQKCRRFEDQKIQELDLKEKQRMLKETQHSLSKKEAVLKENMARLEQLKEANYQREHDIVVAEENLSKKIADFRKKQAELSEWQAELTRKSRGQRDQPRQRDNTLANQFPSNQMSLQNSVEQLNQSGEISLKSFGRNQDGKKRASQEQLDFQPGYKIRTLNYQEDYRQPHEFARERQNYPRPPREERPHLVKPEGKKYGESAYTAKSRQHLLDVNQKRYNPQMSNYSREASPYRNLNEPIRSKPYQLPPKVSPNHYRDISKNSRSTSKSKVGFASQAISTTRGLPPRDNQIGGLGSKLQRLREQIKKEIDSIK